MQAAQHTGVYKGRGAQFNPPNRFDSRSVALTHLEAIDELPAPEVETRYYAEHPKQIVNEVTSPDVGMAYSLNPYQGCEHGCVYCYARNTHEYWGFSAGLDFESRIMVKMNAPELLAQWLRNKNWQPRPIALSGNTDCYQPVERKLGLTRQLLEVFLRHRNPVGIITKNALILRDLDLLQELARLNLVRVAITITAMDENLRRVLEPRTVTYAQRLHVIEQLSRAGIPTTVMVAPIIPALNSHETPRVVAAAAAAGALGAGYTMVRLNGAIGGIFKDWLHKHFPDRAARVWHLIQQCHGGQVNDSRFGTRMRGEGAVADSIVQQFKQAVAQHMHDRKMPAYALHHFTHQPEHLTLF